MRLRKWRESRKSVFAGGVEGVGGGRRAGLRVQEAEAVDGTDGCAAQCQCSRAKGCAKGRDSSPQAGNIGRIRSKQVTGWPTTRCIHGYPLVLVEYAEALHRHRYQVPASTRQCLSSCSPQQRLGIRPWRLRGLLEPGSSGARPSTALLISAPFVATPAARIS